jgi:hypothetical protein
MSDEVKKALVAKVPFGTFEIDGLLFEDGSYGVAIPQISDLFMTNRNTASRDLKRLLGEGFKTSKTKTEFNKNTTLSISLLEFERVLAKLDRAGNVKAQAFRDGLVGLSLQQLFCDAFGVKFETEQRQEWLEERFKTKKDFRPLTAQLKANGFTENCEYGLFVHKMQQLIGLENGTRDLADLRKLKELDNIQTSLIAYMECGLKPYDALAKYSKKLKTP